MKAIIQSVILLITVSLIACKKDHDQQEGQLLKRTLRVVEGVPEAIDTFLYDNQRRLIGIKYANNTSSYDQAIEFDAQGRLSKVIFSYQGAVSYACTFIYNNAGQIIKKVAAPSQGYEYAYNESFSYDSKGRVISDTTYYKQTNTIQYYSTYRYDDNWNIVEIDFKNLVDPAASGKQTNIFDNKPNPYNLQGSIYYYIRGNTFYLNKNNRIGSMGNEAAPEVTQIEYQKNGLPNKIAFRYSSPFSFQSTILFEYW